MSEHFAWIYDKTRNVKTWCADMWSRRNILTLQDDVSSLETAVGNIPTKTSDLTNDSGYITSSDIPTIPSASTANPQMDGTASAGTSSNWSRGDHVHPSDTSKQDALSTAQLNAVNSGITAAKVSTYDAISVPTAVSELTNDSGYQTSADVSDAISAEAGLLVPYGYCSTATATAAKTVTVSPTVTALTAGLIIAVKFQYANTVASPTLNVNSLGAKSIKRYGTTAPSTSAASSWNANSVVMLTYDGTYWMLADWNNTTYSGMSDAEYQAGTSTSNRLITPKRLKAAIELHAPVTSVNGSTGAVTVTVPTQTSDLTNDSGYITASNIPTNVSAFTNDAGYLTSAPVVSVNGNTGAVTLDASDVGALPDSTVIPTVPTNVSAFTNDAGYLTSAPVTSVNSQTGAVTLDASDVGALPDSTTIPSKTSDLTNDSGFITSSSVPSASSATPQMDGTASAGSSADYSRADHVHPTDTSKQDALTTAQLNAVNSGITAAKVSTYDAITVPSASSTTPAMDGTAAVGSETAYARGDHVHPSDTSKQDALSTAQLAACNSGITAETLTALSAFSQLSTTYTSNSYVTSTAFARLHFFRIGEHLIVFACNLQVTAAMTDGAFHTIGSISGVTLQEAQSVVLTGQNGTGHTVLLSLQTGGTIQVYSKTASTVNEFFRAIFPLVVASFS